MLIWVRISILLLRLSLGVIFISSRCFTGSHVSLIHFVWYQTTDKLRTLLFPPYNSLISFYPFLCNSKGIINVSVRFLSIFINFMLLFDCFCPFMVCLKLFLIFYNLFSFQVWYFAKVFTPFQPFQILSRYNLNLQFILLGFHVIGGL